jgi:hypothetical protein
MGFELIANEKYSREPLPTRLAERNHDAAPGSAIGTADLLPLYIVTPIG